MAVEAKPVLITGCSSGIGHATALRLARGGWNVYASARRPDTLDELVEVGCTALPLDVTSEESMQAAVAEIEQRDGVLGYLVNNAGYSQSGAVETLPLDSIRRQFETNVFGLVRLCQLALPGMREAGFGRIVNISSMGGELTFAGGGAYHATKHAVEAFSDALRYEVAGFGVGVTVVQPGLIRTEFATAAVDSLAEARPASEPGADANGDPYSRFNRALGALTRAAYRPPVAWVGAGPEAVARTIERALSRRSAPPRVRVTPSAHAAIASRRLLTSRGWDLMQRLVMPRPGR